MAEKIDDARLRGLPQDQIDELLAYYLHREIAAEVLGGIYTQTESDINYLKGKRLFQLLEQEEEQEKGQISSDLIQIGGVTREQLVESFVEQIEELNSSEYHRRVWHKYAPLGLPFPHIE